MKKLTLLITALIVCSSSAHAEGEAVKRAREGWDSLVKTYQSAVNSGRPAAERLVRQAPKHFRGLVGNANFILKQLHDAANPADFEQKKQLALELWRIRGGLDVLSLLTPESIQALTGLNLQEFQTFRTKVSKTLSEYGLARRSTRS